MMAGLFVLVGCSSVKLSQAPTFADSYQSLAESVRPAEVLENGGRLLTLTASQISIPDFLRYIAQQTGESVVCEAGLDNSKVDINVQNQPVGQVLQVVARRLGADLTKVGNISYMGHLAPEDKGIMCRRVSRLNGNDLRAAVTVLLSETGRVQAFDDGLIIVGDKVAVLQRVNEMIERLEAAGADSWVVQMIFADRIDSKSHDVGVDASPVADVAYVFAAGSDSSSSFIGTAKLSAAFRAVLTRQNKRALFSPLFVVAEGAKANFKSGQDIPVNRPKTVNNVGVSEQGGYDFKETGTTCSVQIRQMGGSLASLTVKASMSTFDGYDPKNEGPIISHKDFETLANIKSGGVYLLGSFDSESADKQWAGPLSLRGSGGTTKTGVDIWARVYKVAAATVAPSVNSNDVGAPTAIKPTTGPTEPRQASEGGGASREASENDRTSDSYQTSWQAAMKRAGR